MDNKQEFSTSQGLLAYQINIYKGLLYIGEEIASFYLDGVRLLNDDNLKIKAYLLGHIAREIDGGFRDSFKVSEKRELCDTCRQEIKQENYIDSIANTLGVDKGDGFVKQWHKIAKNFHKYSHRHGAWKKPRDTTEMINLWNDYEKILYKLIGSYIDFVSRIDRILEYQEPTDDLIELLNNAFENEGYKIYFFKKLKWPKWFIPLKEKGYFSSHKAPGPEPADKEGSFSIPFWNVLDYLERVSEQVNIPENEKYIDELLNIIKEVTNYHLQTKKIDQPLKIFSRNFWEMNTNIDYLHGLHYTLLEKCGMIIKNTSGI